MPEEREYTQWPAGVTVERVRGLVQIIHDEATQIADDRAVIIVGAAVVLGGWLG